MKNKGIFIVISGPSGVGKGTIINNLMPSLKGAYSISATTRKKRENETDKKDYYFITKEEFLNKIDKDEFLEYTIYDDEYYGTLKSQVLDKINSNIDVISEIDINGAKSIKEKYKDALLIFILPPNINELKNRLIKRNTDSIEQINSRINIAYEELKETEIYDYIVINDNLEETVENIKNIIKNYKEKIINT